MKLSEIKKILKNIDKIAFQLPNGTFVSSHFHVTEVGKVTKDFIDCGGKVRNETVINFQLWEQNDYDHRLHPDKLINIITLSEKMFMFEDLEIEVEYQGEETIGKYNLDFDGVNFLLTSKVTACLAIDACGISVEKTKVDIPEVQSSGCDPTSGCC
ncbi:DUF6428 family protein [Flavobacteriaceae bacterium]|jgi:hypothetical protein|nr:DUF6428 family protein [Flavobacteriaceae bacterium]